MKLKVNNTPVPTLPDGVLIEVAVDPRGETLPPTKILATGGRLDVYPRHTTTDGDVHLHYFGDDAKLQIAVLALREIEVASSTAISWDTERLRQIHARARQALSDLSL